MVLSAYKVRKRKKRRNAPAMPRAKRKYPTQGKQKNQRTWGKINSRNVLTIGSRSDNSALRDALGSATDKLSYIIYPYRMESNKLDLHAGATTNKLNMKETIGIFGIICILLGSIFGESHSSLWILSAIGLVLLMLCLLMILYKKG